MTGVGRAEDSAKHGHETGHFVNTITKLKMNFRGDGSECFLESGVNVINDLVKERINTKAYKKDIRFKCGM